MEAKKEPPRIRPWMTRIVMFLITVFTCVHLVVPANAYTLIYIQCSIDITTWEILTVAVRDEVGLSSNSNEKRRVLQDALDTMHDNQTTAGGSNLSLIQGLSNDVSERNRSLASKGNIISGLLQNTGAFNETNRVLSFPTNQTRRDSSTSADFNDAMNVVNAISYDLNHAFSVYLEKNNITKTQDATAFHSAMVNFLTAVQSSMNSDGTLTYDGTKFIWYTEKSPGSGEYVNWYMLVYEAFNNYALSGDEAVTSDNVYTSTPNQLTQAIVGFFSDALDGLRGILGLWSMDELIFNQGWRSAGYVGGIFPASWEPYIWALFIFMEVFAAMILLYGVLNNVVKKAMSTVNTIARLHFMSQLQSLLVCAIALALLPIILRIVITLSSSLTSIIYELVPVDAATSKKRAIADAVARYSSGSGSIGGIIAQFMFFGVQVSFNFIYAMRSLAVSILIIIAPVMIAMIAVSDARKQATISWAKELLAQICIQPIHAFCMAVILLLPTSSHGFDNIIALYALIPFSSVIKGFFFGAAGSWSEQASQRAKGKLTGTLAAGAMGAAGAVVGGLAGAAFGGNGEKESSGGSEKQTEQSSGGQDLNQGGSTGASEKQRDQFADTKAAASEFSADPSLQTAGIVARTALSDAVDAARNSKPAQAIGSVLGKTNTAQAMRENAAEPDSLASSGASRALNTAGGVLKDMGTAVVSTGKTALKVGAGMSLGAVGGVLGGVSGNRLINLGANMTGAAIVGGCIADAESDMEPTNPEPDLNRPNQQQTENDAEQNGRQDVPPVGFEGGKQKASAPDGMEVYDYDSQALAQMGIGDVESTRSDVEFGVSGDSHQAQEFGAYADYLSTLPEKDRTMEVSRSGISATRTGDDVQVRLNKRQWSAAQSGARIDVHDNAHGQVLRVQSRPGSAPSLVGSYQGTVDAEAVAGMRRTPTEYRGVAAEKLTIPAQSLSAAQRATIEAAPGVTSLIGQNGEVSGYQVTVEPGASPVFQQRTQDGADVSSYRQIVSGEPVHTEVIGTGMGNLNDLADKKERQTAYKEMRSKNPNMPANQVLQAVRSEQDNRRTEQVLPVEQGQKESLPLPGQNAAPPDRSNVHTHQAAGASQVDAETEAFMNGDLPESGDA